MVFQLLLGCFQRGLCNFLRALLGIFLIGPDSLSDTKGYIASNLVPKWMPNRLLRPSKAASPTLLAASMMVPMEFLRPFAIPLTMSLPICIQSNSKNLALTLVNTCGSFPTSSGMACMIPAASSPSNSIPFCRISGRWLAIVAIICISASAAAPITAGRFDRIP